jgi:hypothetical protein
MNPWIKSEKSIRITNHSSESGPNTILFPFSRFVSPLAFFLFLRHVFSFYAFSHFSIKMMITKVAVAPIGDITSDLTINSLMEENYVTVGLEVCNRWIVGELNCYLYIPKLGAFFPPDGPSRPQRKLKPPLLVYQP